MSQPIAGIPTFEAAPLYWLAAGTFAVGTEGFMIAAILPGIAADLTVSLQAVAQLITVFALVYALSSPLLTALTGHINRRTMLLVSMGAFVASNLVAAAATGYGFLLFARILIALAAGLYVPSASALAGALVPPQRRGHALAIVTGGLSLAVALGVPLGAFIGVHFGWRSTFLGVAGLGTIAIAGLLFGLPHTIGGGFHVATLRERVAIVRQPAVFPALLVTTLWAMGTYTVYTYVTPLLSTVAGLASAHIGYALFLWGTAAFTGLLSSGAANDRFGSHRVISLVLPLLALTLATLSLFAFDLTPATAFIPALIAVSLWGFSAWAFLPAQQARLIGLTGLKGASIVLSLNASFMYLGFSLGAVLGSFVLTHGGVANLGWVGAVSVLSAFLLYLATHRSK